MRSTRRAAVVVVLLMAGGAGSAAAQHVSPVQNPGSATYVGIYDKEPITLKNGVYEGAPFIAGGAMRPRVELIDEATITGDLDSRTGRETIVLLLESSGGSGTGLYLAVMPAPDGNFISPAHAVLVGDRVQVRSFAVANRSVVMETVEAGPDDPMCCPTAKVRRSWSFEKGRLTQGTPEPQGTVSPSDLEGRVWTLESLDWKDPLPAGVTVTAEFKIAKAPAGVTIPEGLGGSVSGIGGCNRYRAGVKPGGGAQSLVVSPATATRMACSGDQMQVEDAYFSALVQAFSFSFMPGNRLLLLSRGKDEPRRLVFVAARK